jgi:hypothetical protein
MVISQRLCRRVGQKSGENSPGFYTSAEFCVITAVRYNSHVQPKSGDKTIFLVIGRRHASL